MCVLLRLHSLYFGCTYREITDRRPTEHRENSDSTPNPQKCDFLIFAIAIGCLVLADFPASYCPPPFCLSIVSNNIRVPLRSATRLAFASGLANILRSLPVTLEYPEHPSPSPVNARRCPVSRVPIPSRHLVKLLRFRPQEFLPLHLTLYTLHQKNHQKSDFSCTIQNNSLPLRPKAQRRGLEGGKCPLSESQII